MKISRKMSWASAALMSMVVSCAGPQIDLADDEPLGLEEDTSDLTFACSDSKPISAEASDDDGNVAASTLDNSLTTRWSCLGVGCSITYDIGASKEFCGVSVAWYNGSTRKSTFTVSLSGDGQQFTQVYSGVSSGTTKNLETYPVAGSGRYMKITVNGNTVNQWASITEVAVDAGSPPPPEEEPPAEICAEVSPVSVAASANDGNVPANTLDGNLATRWSCLGLGCYITFDMGVSKNFCDASIAWYAGNARKSTFVISVSPDGSQFAQIFSGVSSGTTTALESYAISGSGRYLRITVNGNTVNQWASISEVKLSAGGQAPPPPDDVPPPDDGGGMGGAADVNGVAYLPIAGYRYLSERFDWTKNFRSDGSMRHDFKGARDSNQCVVGYFNINGPADEEISVKLASGPHNDTNPTWADTYDLGVTNFAGTRARLRYEKTHPRYTAGPSKTITTGDVRNRWVGAMGCKLNKDSNGDGTPDTARILAFVDRSGLDSSGKPQNVWQPTMDLSIPFANVDLKSPATPYVVTIGKGETANATIRIDGQGANGNGYLYKFVAYRALSPM